MNRSMPGLPVHHQLPEFTQTHVSHFSRVQFCVTPWTAACQAPLSMRFSRQEYWSELPCPPPGDLPDSEMEPGSPALQAEVFTTEPPG